MVIKVSIGLFGGIFNREGKLLVKKRGTDEFLSGDWDLPGGGVEVFFAENASDESLIAEELAREVLEETGLNISGKVQSMPAMYPAILPDKDWAFAIIVGVIDEDPTIGEYKFVSPKELQELAEDFVGNRLVSGSGKRMHRMCLCMLSSRDSPNSEYRKEAIRMLREIQSE